MTLDSYLGSYIKHWNRNNLGMSSPKTKVAHVSKKIKTKREKLVIQDLDKYISIEDGNG